MFLPKHTKIVYMNCVSLIKRMYLQQRKKYLQFFNIKHAYRLDLIAVLIAEYETTLLLLVSYGSKTYSRIYLMHVKRFLLISFASSHTVKIKF